MSSIGLNPTKSHLRFVPRKGYQAQVWIPDELRVHVAELAGKSKPVAQLTTYLSDKSLPPPTRDDKGKLVYPASALRAAMPVMATFNGWIETARAGRPVMVFDMRTPDTYSFYTPAQFTLRDRVVSLPVGTAGLAKIASDAYVLNDPDNAIVDITPTEFVIGLDQALADWKKWHGAWPDTDAGRKAEKQATHAKTRPAKLLFDSAVTDNMAAITTPMIQKWVDGLEGRVAYDCVLGIKTLYKRLQKANRFAGTGIENPAEQIELPRKPKHKGRNEFAPPDAKRILDSAALSDDPLIHWGVPIMAFMGMIHTEFVYAPTHEIGVIAGVWCWHVGEDRDLKCENRPRVMPIPDYLIEAGFLDYVASRGDGLLFDVDNHQASVALMKHLRGLGITGSDQVNYSHRHGFISRLVNAKTDPTLRRYLDGHGLTAIDEMHYIHHHMPQMVAAMRAVKPTEPYEVVAEAA